MNNPEQPKASVEKSTRKLWYTLAGLAVIVLIIAWGGWYVQSQRTIPESQQPIKETSPVTSPQTPQHFVWEEEPHAQTPPSQSKNKYYQRGYLKWDMKETDLGDLKRVEGRVLWNEKSGADGEPVIGMPLIVAVADHKKKELTEIANGVTDSNGRFRLIIPTTTGDIRLGCDFEKARNIPQKVILEQGRKNRSAEEDRLLQKVMDVERRVNSETTWGNKVNRWIDNQQTAVYVDYSSSTAAWYDSKNDRIVFNPQRAMPHEQLLEELKKGYLHTFILRFHEELHRAQNRRSGRTQANLEMALLREIHAYWLSHLSSVSQLYEGV